jgi:DNA gyrase subunit B
VALKDASIQTGGSTSTTLAGDTLAELARKHQLAEAVIARLRNFMDAEALRAIADGVALDLDTTPAAEASPRRCRSSCASSTPPARRPK